MKNFAYLVAGVSAAVAYFLIKQQQSGENGRRRSAAGAGDVEGLAHELEEAWADHHTRV